MACPDTIVPMSVEEAAIAALRAAGWRFAAPETRGPDASTDAMGASDAWAASFSRLSSADDAVWFLSREDYRESVNDAFAWNTFETLSREAAATESETERVADFWRRHRPILLSVRGRYAYLAVREDGTVVAGEEPEFEETHVVAGDLGGVLRMIAHRSFPETGALDRLLFGA